MSGKKRTDVLENTLKFLSFVFFQGMIAAAWLLLIPKEAGNADFLGYSFRRLALLIPILGAAAVAGLLRLVLKKRSAWQTQLTDDHRRAVLSRTGIVFGFLLALGAWLFLFFFHFLDLTDDIGAYVRLLPFFVYIFAVGVECLFFVNFTWLSGRKNPNGPKFKALFGRVFWIVLAFLLVVWLVIALTGIGEAPELVSIIAFGVPLLEGQIWFMAGLIALILCLAGSWSNLPQQAGNGRKWNVDLLTCLALWALAAALWLSLPLPQHNYFAPETLPPNYHIYPFSDAEQYDMNSLWVWKGSIKDTVISKPLYVVFLSILHALVGLDYGKVVLLQTLVLAILPAVIFLIGKEMHSRLGGLMLALLVILREMNSIQAINVANVANSKLLLSDMPATLLVCVLILVMIRWFKSPRGKVGLPPFAAGGIIGCLILMRIQSLILVPLFIFLIILRHWKQLKKMLSAGALLLLAMMLVLTPVLVRNHDLINVYWVDNPSSYALGEWLLRGSDVEMAVPDSGTADEMMDANVEVVSTIIGSNIWGYAYHVVDNFMHNTLSTILILPVRLGNGVDFIQFMKIRDPFWSEMYSQGNLWNALVVLFNLIVISIGMASAARKNRVVLLLMLLFYIVYSFSSAVVRLSGWRYIMPVDWLVMAFFVFGLIDFLRWLCARVLGWNGFGEADRLTVYEPLLETSPLNWKPVLTLGLVFFLSGAFINLRETFLPADYPDYTRAEVCSAIQSALVGSPWENQSTELVDYCRREDILAYEGTGVYPRFFKAESGFYNRLHDPFFGIQDYGRLVFRTVGEPNSKVYIRTEDENIRFPDGTPVYVVGPQKAKFEARIVLIMGDEPQLIVSSADFSDAE